MSGAHVLVVLVDNFIAAQAAYNALSEKSPASELAVARAHMYMAALRLARCVAAEVGAVRG